MAFVPGQKVRVTATPNSKILPVGTEGLVIREAFADAYFIEAPGLDRPLGTYGYGYALEGRELEAVE